MKEGTLLINFSREIPFASTQNRVHGIFLISFTHVVNFYIAAGERVISPHLE